MKLGLTTVAAVTPAVHVGDVDFNVVACVEETKSAVAHGAQVVILPECVLTAYTCNDLFRRAFGRGAQAAHPHL